MRQPHVFAGKGSNVGLSWGKSAVLAIASCRRRKHGFDSDTPPPFLDCGYRW